MAQSISYWLLVLAYITAQRQLIHEKTASRSEWNTKYDFIVVGAGSAGSAVAMRLSEDKTINVLLLEAGGPQSATYNDIPGMVLYINQDGINVWEYYNKRQDRAGQIYPGGRIPEFKGKTLGGSGAHNAMVFNRGNRRGYDNWAKTYGAKGWSFAEILYYFLKFENNTDLKIVKQNPGFHGTKGPMQITTPSITSKIQFLLNKAFNKMGFSKTDVNGPNQMGYTLMQSFITSDSLRSGTGNAYIDPNPHPENLHIVCKALVVKILFNGLTAIGVEFIKNSKSYKVFADKEVVISAGSINSPQLLMLSGIGHKDHLRKIGIPNKLDLPVGDNYENHPVFSLTVSLNQSQSITLPQLTGEQLTQLYLHRKGALSELPISVLYFSTQSNIDSNWPNIQMSAAPVYNVLVLGIELVRSRSRGTIRLQSTDPFLSPLIDPKYFSDSKDFTDLVDGIRFMYYVLETSSISKYITIPSFASLGCSDCPDIPKYECFQGIECLISLYTSTKYHNSGSCRMGAIRRSDVVVDPYLRVKNVRNLRVCDSSIFPELPNANTNAASIMVGEKCAQIIKDCYKVF